ncbi:MAG: tetratricopeptide repeat protein [Rhodospirillaceae bacterium]|nr:tetratricopeptide repeat protein [Rhodospirillaceae bacterium]MBT5244255.1 tetratricopeptide repeat protein [Rhodospirillaceae bacterium]MBT5561780.1 tetratricopeptide repeat protein [Rhodospirillaceae bacterium]MBT6243219.1 tetratricopeptide repeat protein [Rhodospirillaceae bacterium]
MAEPIEEGIFREIDDELRQEQFAKLWKRYGRIFVVGAVLVVTTVAGYKAWESYDISNRGQQGERFAASLRLAQDGNGEAALDALNIFNSEAGAGYQMLSGFNAAALMADQGDDGGAIAAYDKLAGDSSLQSVYRDLAVLLGAISRLNNGEDSAALTDRLTPLSASENPWQHSARELMAVVAQQAGDKAKARELFKALSEDATAPQGIRQRAGEMLAALAE